MIRASVLDALAVAACLALAACQSFVFTPSQPLAEAPIVPGNVDCGAFEPELCLEVLAVARRGLADSRDDLQQSFTTAELEAVPREGECVTTPDCERYFAVVQFAFEDGQSVNLHIYRTELTGDMHVRFN